FAVTMFRGQYLNSHFPAPIAGALLRSRWHNAACLRLGMVALTALIALVPTTAQSLPTFALTVLLFDVLALIFTTVGIQRGIGGTLTKDLPRSVADIILRHAHPDSRLTLMEQTVVQCLRDGDLATAHLVLQMYSETVLIEVRARPSA